MQNCEKFNMFATKFLSGMKLFYFVLCFTLLTVKISAQTVDFMSDDFNAVSSWEQSGDFFVNNGENFIVHNSVSEGTDLISKRLENFYPERGSVTWSVDLQASFKSSSVNNFQVFFISNSENIESQNFEAVGLSTGVKNSLCFIKRTGKKQETLYTFQDGFTSGVFTVTRSVSGEWTVNGETVYNDGGKICSADFLLVKFTFNNTGAKKFAFKFSEFFFIAENCPEYLQALPSEIIINEIMADVSPAPFALPEKKYVELFNRSRNAFNLKNYTFIIGSDVFLLPDTVLKPGGYLVLDGDFVNKLTVSGKFLALKNAGGKVIDSLTYSVLMYNDEDKKSGGFSMERIDPENFCFQLDNWKAAVDLSGGTPGRQNSVYQEGTTKKFPKEISVEKVFAVNKNQALVWFSTELTRVEADGNFSLTSDKKAVLASFEEDFQDGKKYSLQIKNAENRFCSAFLPTEKSFVYKKPEYQDIVINEILFNPLTGAKRFIEIFNNTNSEISLYGLSFSSPTTEKSCTISEFLFLKPYEYAVLTSDSSDIQSHYDCGGSFIQDKKFPTLDEKEGVLVLKNIDGILLDSVYYSKKFHNKFLNTQDGVSLERVDFRDDTNWKSALETAGFATPGRENSQEVFLPKEEDVISHNEISVENQLFTPLNGDNEFTLVFNFKNPETTINVSVYDSNGRHQKTLAENFVAGYNDKVSWNGLDENENRCKIGIYIVLIKTADQSGNTKNYKKVCVIGTNN